MRPHVSLVLQISLLTLLALRGAGLAQSANAPGSGALSWKQLPSLPDREGVAGAFAGVSHGALIVAGGAFFAGDKWGGSAAKTWATAAYVLEEKSGSWKAEFRLSRPLGYGVSITADEAVLCLGGSDAKQHYADCFRLEWVAGTPDRRRRDQLVERSSLPPLPRACANACGALVGRTVYVAGGIDAPGATEALHTFWALDLDARPLAWRDLEPWPGPERMLAVAGEHGGAFYLFSGARLHAGADGQVTRESLRDAYRFTKSEGWKRLADLPRATVAAASPARYANGLGLLLLSGDDGVNTNLFPLAKHPGFPHAALAYDPATDAWSEAGPVPFSRATVSAVWWRDRLVLPSGEVRPRVRTPEVWALEVPAK